MCCHSNIDPPTSCGTLRKHSHLIHYRLFLIKDKQMLQNNASRKSFIILNPKMQYLENMALVGRQGEIYLHKASVIFKDKPCLFNLAVSSKPSPPQGLGFITKQCTRLL